MSNEQSFLRNHVDTLAIIGVNIAIATVLLTISMSQGNRIDVTNARMDSNFAAANARLDAANVRMDGMYTMFYDLLKEVKDKK